MFSTLLSLPIPAVRAEGVSSGPVGPTEGGGSITMQAVNPETGLPIAEREMRAGMKVKLEIHAYDSYGKSVDCGPHLTPEQGVTGEQISAVDDASQTFVVGKGFGSGAVHVDCKNLPNVKAQFNVRNVSTLGGPGLMAPAAAPPAPLMAPVAAPAASLMTPEEGLKDSLNAGGESAAPVAAPGDTGGALLLGLLAVGGGAYLLGKAISGSSGGNSDCSTRTCVRGISCECSGTISTTCDSTLPVTSSGSACLSGQSRIAWCPKNTSCTNGTCSTSCP